MALLAILLSGFIGMKDDLGEQGEKGKEIYVWQKPKLISRWGDRKAKTFSTTMWNLNSPRLHVNRKPSTPSITRTIQPIKSFCAISTWLEMTYNSIHIFNRPRFPIHYSNSYSWTIFFLNYFQRIKRTLIFSYFESVKKYISFISKFYSMITKLRRSISPFSLFSFVKKITPRIYNLFNRAYKSHVKNCRDL